MSNAPTAGFDVRIRGIGSRQAKAIDLEGAAVLAKVVPQTGKKGPSLVVWSRKCARQTGNLFQVLVEQMQSLIRLGGIRIGMGVVSHWQPSAQLSDQVSQERPLSALFTTIYQSEANRVGCCSIETLALSWGASTGEPGPWACTLRSPARAIDGR